MPIADVLDNEYPGVEKTVIISKRLLGDCNTGEKIISIRGLFANQNFLDVFGFSLEVGDQGSALIEPFSIILSEESAVKLFNTKDVIGKVIEIGSLGVYTVRGIVKNHSRKKSHYF